MRKYVYKAILMRCSVAKSNTGRYFIFTMVLYYYIRESEAIDMALAEATKTIDNTMTVNDAMDELLSKLDVAIDDMEQGRVQSIDDAWKEIDRI